MTAGLWTPSSLVGQYGARLMPVDVSALQAWQSRLGTLVMGPGTAYTVNKVDGMGTPPVRSSSTARSGRSGDLRGRPTLGGRTVTMEIIVSIDGNGTWSGIEAAVTALQAAFVPTTDLIPFVYWHPPDGPRLMIVEPRKCSYPLDRAAAYGLTICATEIDSPDPFKYDTTLQQQTIGVYNPGGGNVFNAVFNQTFPGLTSAGVIAAVNAGTAPTAPLVRFNGPLIDPVLENTTTGESLAITMTVDAASYIDVDMDEHTVIYNSVASVRGVVDVSSTWWTLRPGTSQVRFRSRGGSTTSTATMSWRSAWY